MVIPNNPGDPPFVRHCLRDIQADITNSNEIGFGDLIDNVCHVHTAYPPGSDNC